MRPRRATPEERAKMTQLVRDFITNHGWGALDRVIDQAEADLRPPYTPHQQRRIKAEQEQAKFRRKLEWERQAAATAAAAEQERRWYTAEVRHRVCAEMDIIRGIKREPLWIHWRGLTVTRAGLHKSIRATLWANGLVRDDAFFVLADAKTMRPAVEALIAWERKQLGKLLLRLDKAGERIEGRKRRATKRQVDEVKSLKADGLGTTDIARRLGLSRKSVWRIVGPKMGSATEANSAIPTTENIGIVFPDAAVKRWAPVVPELAGKAADAAVILARLLEDGALSSSEAFLSYSAIAKLMPGKGGAVRPMTSGNFRSRVADSNSWKDHLASLGLVEAAQSLGEAVPRGGRNWWRPMKPRTGWTASQIDLPRGSNSYQSLIMII